MQQQRVAHAPGHRTGHQALIVLHLNGLRAGAPQGVQYALDILLMHHQVVGRRIPWKPAVCVPFGIGERHDKAGPGDGPHAGGIGHLSGLGERSRHLAVASR
ncbi:Uncharacterised protein [Mycobacteroides abscessus subsp. abscessus]|nr:Uncharacterised protein [Mycobacteroides abscessus subsp. abscessus]